MIMDARLRSTTSPVARVKRCTSFAQRIVAGSQRQSLQAKTNGDARAAARLGTAATPPPATGAPLDEAEIIHLQQARPWIMALFENRPTYAIGDEDRHVFDSRAFLAYVCMRDFIRVQSVTRPV